MLLIKFDTYGDPLYFEYGGKIFTGEFGTLQSVNTSNLDYTAINYIDEHGIMQFIDRFFITGIFNIVEQLTRISFPYLIFLIPFGIIFSFIFGLAFAAAWTPCVGPILGTILTLAAATPAHALNIMLMYSLGLGIPFILMGVFLSRGTKLIKKMNKHLKYYNLIKIILI